MGTKILGEIGEMLGRGLGEGGGNLFKICEQMLFTGNEEDWPMSTHKDLCKGINPL